MESSATDHSENWQLSKDLSAPEWINGLWLCGHPVKYYTVVKMNDRLSMQQYAGILATENGDEKVPRDSVPHDTFPIKLKTIKIKKKFYGLHMDALKL